jgi:hypothetical protein
MTMLQAIVNVVGNDLKQREAGRLFVSPDGSVRANRSGEETAAILRSTFYSRFVRRRVAKADGEDFLRVLPEQYGGGSRVSVVLIEDKET